jgi:hypothetical protein
MQDDESLFEIEVLDEAPEGYGADTAVVAGAAGNSCSCNDEEQVPL